MIKKSSFIPGNSYVPVSGKVYDQDEINYAIEAARDAWWTEGRFVKEFESQFKKFMGVRYVSLVNSGSSANLIALYSLTSNVFGKKALKKGDEFITAAVGFPTTVNPGIQFGLIPVFIDVDLKTLNMDVNQIEKALSPKTKLIMMAHTLGIPYDLEKVLYLVKKYDLWLIEDSCDALGSRYDGKLVGTFGHIATYSFYPAHQMSCAKNTPIPYLDEMGKWKLEPIENIYLKFVHQPKQIKILSFDKNNIVDWTRPSAILRHKLGSSKKMMRIKTQHGREVDVTEDHSIFIIDKDKAEIMPIAAKDLKADDYIVTTNAIPAHNPVAYVDIIDVFRNKNAYVSHFSEVNLKYVKNGDYRWQYKSRNSLPIRYLKHLDLDKHQLSIGISQSLKIPARLIIDKDLCRLLGYFMAEGSYQNGLIFSFSTKETDLINDVVMISKKQFRITPSVSKSRNSVTQVEIQSKNLEIVFQQVFHIKKGAHNKRIPWFVFQTNSECIKAFIYGYTKGDGSERILKDNTNRIDVTSVSKTLLNDFQYVLSTIGISASFYRRNKSNEDKVIKKKITSNSENYTLCFSGYQYHDKTIVKQNIRNRNNVADQIPLLPIFRKYLHISKNQKVVSRKRLQNYLQSNPQLYSLVTGHLSFLKVRRIVEVPYDKDEYVYDFSVPGKENFYGGFLGIFLHNTMGEGGAIITNNPYIHRSIRQFRDWGRDCWCDTGKDNTCGKRFGWKLGELPEGYDHKYIYSQIGFNVKLTDFQAAIGVAQLKKVPLFIEKRKKNYKKLHDFFSQYPKYFSLIELSKKEDPCWFGFPLIVKKEAPFSRNELTEYLEKNKIGTRNVFAGNLLAHPAYLNLKKKRVIGKVKNANVVMNQAFWMGVFPGIEKKQMDYVLTTLKYFLSKYS